MPKPVLAAVNGPAVGIGCSLALACDLVIARESAYFLLAFVNIGLVPDGGSSALVPSGSASRARPRWRCSASASRRRKALEWGLINRVVPDDAFDAEVERWPTGWPPARRAPTRATKRQLNAWLFAAWSEQLDLEAEIQQESAARRTSARACWRSWRSGPPAFRGA